MIPNVEIRAVQAADCEALLEMILEHARFEHSEATISDEVLLKLIDNDRPPVFIFVAVSNEGMVGYVALTLDYSLWRGSRWGYLDCLYMKPGSRGLGIGAQLFRHAASIARNCGADRLEWQTPDWNSRAVSFYEREGAVGQGKVRFALEL